MCALPLSADERSPSGGITIEPSSAQQNALPTLPIYGALALLTSVRRALDHLLLHTFVGLLMFIWAVSFTASSAAIKCYASLQRRHTFWALVCSSDCCSNCFSGG